MRIAKDSINIGQTLEIKPHVYWKKDRWGGFVNIPPKPIKHDGWVDSNSLDQLKKNPENFQLIPEGTIITILGKGHFYEFSINVSKPVTCKVYTSDLAKIARFGDQEVIKGEDIKQYRIYKDGEIHKKKYFKDLGKVKASLICDFNYHDEVKAKANKTISPEASMEVTGEYDGVTASWDNLTRADAKNMEVKVIINKDFKNPQPTDFNVLEYYDELFKMGHVTAQFGSATRIVYKKIKEAEEFNYVLLYLSSEYIKWRENFNAKEWSHDSEVSEFKECKKIKTILKETGFKRGEMFKSSKYGKTAIGLKTIDDVIKISEKLTDDAYYILDIDGDTIKCDENNMFTKFDLL